MTAPESVDGRDRLHVVDRAPLPPHEAEGAPLVVLVHGAMDRGGSFGRVASRLGEVRLRTYDRRGYAGSWAVGPSERFEHQVDDLIDVVDGQRAVLVGHSFGGTVVLTVAARRPDLVAAAVVFEPPAPWEPWWPSSTQRSSVGRSPEDTAEAFMRRVVGDRIWDRLPSTTREQRRAEGATLLAELRSVGGTRPYEPAEVRVPVVAAWGSESPEHMRRAARLLVGELPDVTGVEVPGSNHGVHLTHPVALADLIRVAIGRSAP